MELSQVSTQNLEDDPIKAISRGLLYYVHTGRNAWHSTWVTQYSNGCMHTTIESAKHYAEKRRTRGTVFYIKQLPCLIFRTEKATLIVTEINNGNPLSGYSPDSTTDEVGYGYQKIEGALDNYLKIGAPINGLAMSFLPHSRFWNIEPSPRNSTIILSENDPALSIERVNLDDLKAYKSHSMGGNYYLGWKSVEANVKRTAVLDLYRKAKPRKSKNKGAHKNRIST
ncbi:hypothetical protein KDX00_06105 [Cobetia amphilecti]|nr:hypothetical protein KDX00_06105 [Cobetia litoralis]